MRPTHESESDRDGSKFSSEIWEMGYVKTLQLTLTGFQAPSDPSGGVGTGGR